MSDNQPVHKPIVRVPDPLLDPILDHQKQKPNTKPVEKHTEPVVFLAPLHAGEPGAVVRTPNAVLDQYLDKAHFKQPAGYTPPAPQPANIPKDHISHHVVERRPNELVDYILDKQPLKPHQEHPKPVENVQPEVPKTHIPIVEDILDKKFPHKP